MSGKADQIEAQMLGFRSSIDAGMNHYLQWICVEHEAVALTLSYAPLAQHARRKGGLRDREET